MTPFLDVRLAPVGGGLAASVAIFVLTDIGLYQTLDKSLLLNAVQGRNVLLATHGFNVNRPDGLASLSNWAGLLQLDPPSDFLGILLTRDTNWAHGLDYPEEPRIADEAGQLIASFLDDNFGGAASVSFASHSLGARVVLETVSNMSLPVRRVILMAGAIGDNCLNTEFSAAASRIGQISVLASTQDEVLSAAFPVGNFLAGIIAEGHPWWRAALGHQGPASNKPGNVLSPFEIPDDWQFGHGNYLQINPPPHPPIPIPAVVPPNGTPMPAAGAPGWQEAWSAAFASTRFR